MKVFRKEPVVLLLLLGVSGIFLSLALETLETRKELEDELDLEGVLEEGEAAMDKSERNGKFLYGILPLPDRFGGIGGNNAKCVVNRDDKVKERYGYCLSRKDCTRRKATPSDSLCGSGFGATCCIFNATCDASKETITVKRNFVYISHVKNESECLTEYKFPKKPNVCQLRLEFKKFNLRGPMDGECPKSGGKMIIRDPYNSGNNLVLCGKMDEKDHLYLHYGDSNEIRINLDVENDTEFGDVEVLVEQIKCDSPNLAPEGCSQYYTQQRGEVRSFNYQNGAGRQLNSQRYSVCVKAAQGSNSVEWSTCNIEGVNNAFDIKNPPIPGKESSCSSDLVTIPGSMWTTYCRMGSLDMAVETKAKPYILYVNFDDYELLPIPPAPPGPGPHPCPPGYEEEGSDCVPGPTSPTPDFNNTGFCLQYNMK